MEASLCPLQAPPLILGPVPWGDVKALQGDWEEPDPLTKARPHVRMAHSLSLGVRGRPLECLP